MVRCEICNGEGKVPAEEGQEEWDGICQCFADDNEFVCPQCLGSGYVEMPSIA